MKYIVRSNVKDTDGYYWYVSLYGGLTDIELYEKYAERFNTKEEAQSWANSHQEIIEVEND